MFGTFSIPIFGKKMENLGNTKTCAEDNMEIWDKKSFDKNGPNNFRHIKSQDHIIITTKMASAVSSTD